MYSNIVMGKVSLTLSRVIVNGALNTFAFPRISVFFFLLAILLFLRLGHHHIREFFIVNTPLVERQFPRQSNETWLNIYRFDFTRVSRIGHQNPCSFSGVWREQSVRVRLRKRRSLCHPFRRIGVLSSIGQTVANCLAEKGKLSALRRGAFDDSRRQVFEIGVCHQVRLVTHFKDHLHHFPLTEVLDGGCSSLSGSFEQRPLLVVLLNAVAVFTARVSHSNQ